MDLLTAYSKRSNPSSLAAKLRLTTACVQLPPPFISSINVLVDSVSILWLPPERDSHSGHAAAL